MQKFFLIFISLVFFSCKDTIRNIPDKTIKDTLLKNVNKPKYQERPNSLSLLKILDSSLAYARRCRLKNFYKHSYEIFPDDTSFTVTVQMLYGYLFSNDKKHLLIRRKVPWATYLNVYLLNGDDFKLVIEREQNDMTYINDTLKDVDGNNYKDFLIHWYPPSGCCLADMYNIYLYQPQSGSFTNDYEFINPTFFPREKKILGLEYDQPGEAGLYKYKWNNLKVDTIEFIYPSFEKKGKFIKTNKQQYRPTKKEGVLLNSLPQEYLRIDSNALKWFFDKY